MKLLFLLLLASCFGKESSLVFQDHGMIVRERVDRDTFSELTNKVFVPGKCLDCHGNFAQEAAVLSLVRGTDPEKSPLFHMVKDGSMPPEGPALGTEELEIIRKYIEEVNFARLSKQVLVARDCLKCHKAMTDEKAIMKWINPEDPLRSPLWLRTADQSMPKGRAPLTEDELAIVKAYVESFNP